jgi:hypothetical protein
MSTQVLRDEGWPVWAKVLLVAIFALAILAVLPWVFMWTTMASVCIPIMNGMREMMGPGMVR